MKKIYSSIVVLGFSAIGITAQAQAKRLLTLDEAVRLGIQNSKNLKIDQAKIEEATANYLEAKNNRLPSLKVSGSALALGNANVDLKVLKPSENGGSAAPKANSAFYGKCFRFVTALHRW